MVTCKIEPLTKNMDALDLQFDPIPIVPSSTEANFQILELDQQMKQLREKVSQWHEPQNYLPSSPENKKISGSRNMDLFSTMINNNTNEHNDTCNYKQELYLLRRENNKLVLESAFVKQENSVYEKRLREEACFRESLQDDLQRLTKTIESNDKSTSCRDENSNTVVSKMTNIHLLTEQLKAYQQDFYEEHKERKKLREINMELESRLEDAKDTIEKQQKKLLLYSQLVSTPIRTELHLQTSTQTPPKYCKPQSSSLPNSPSYKHNEKKPAISLMSKSYKLSELNQMYKSSEHILEHSINAANISSLPSSPSQSIPHYDHECFALNSEQEFITKGTKIHLPPSLTRNSKQRIQENDGR